MRIYHDADADLALLARRRIAVIGYGNQGRAQALNLRDSGLDVVVGNRDDEYAGRARADGFDVLPIAQAAEQASVVLLLIPDEVMPAVFEAEIAPYLAPGDVLAFASGYTVAFGQIAPPPDVDTVLVAPRMIGAGVRDLYVAGQGFPAFVGVADDASGQARDLALALARGIGATRLGVVEVTFAQEAELDLFTEQCFGPAFGQVLTTAVHLLVDEGYPPEAVLLELYMSGELAYTLQKMAEMGVVEQSTLHSHTSQYGSMSRGMRFLLPELRERMQQGLDEIRSGDFAREWAAEQAAGAPTLESLREAALSLPLSQWERELREALGPTGRGRPAARSGQDRKPAGSPALNRAGFLNRSLARLRRTRGMVRLRQLWRRQEIQAEAEPMDKPLDEAQLAQVLQAFLARAATDPALQTFARDRQMRVHYRLRDADLEFYMDFQDGAVGGNLGPPPAQAQVLLTMKADLLDGMLSGRTNALRAAMSGQLTFGGDARQAMAQQQIQNDLIRLYNEARQDVIPSA